MRQFILSLLLCFLSAASFADSEKLNETLVRIINQINAIQPLLDEAKKDIDPTARIRLHIEAFEGADGQKHPGLRDDLLSIRNSLIDYINHPVIAPRHIEPLTMDFIQHD